MDESANLGKLHFTTVQIALGGAIFLLPCNFFQNPTLVHVITYTNRMTISGYNTKPACETGQLF